VYGAQGYLPSPRQGRAASGRGDLHWRQLSPL